MVGALVRALHPLLPPPPPPSTRPGIIVGEKLHKVYLWVTNKHTLELLSPKSRKRGIFANISARVVAPWQMDHVPIKS